MIVVWGGLAGLSAACMAAEGNYSVLLVEEKPFLGGRAASFEWKRNILDVGQHLHVAQFSHYLAFARKLGLSNQIYTQPELEVDLIDADGAKASIGSSFLPPPLHLGPSLMDFPYLNPLDKLRITGPVLAGLLPANFSSRRREVFGDWLRRYGASNSTIRQLWNPIIIATLNAPVDKVSVQLGLMILRRVLLSKKGGRLGWLKCPHSVMMDRARQYIESRGGKVQVSTSVSAVNVDDGEFRSVVTGDGEKIHGETCISAVPSHELLSLLPKDMQNHDHFENFTGIQWNPIVNLHMFLDRPVMEEVMLGVVGSDTQWLFDIEEIKDVSEGPHLCASISYAKDLIQSRPDRILAKAISQLRKFLPKLRDAEVRDYAVLKQPRATFSPHPKTQGLRPESNTPVSGLYLAGDWTDTGWPSTMESAVRSGLQACREATGSGE